MMKQYSYGRPATQIEVEAFTAIANLQDENRELKLKIQELKSALTSVISQGGNLSDEALEVNGINDGRSRLIMYLNSRDIALKALGFNNIKEWWEKNR